MSPQSGQNKDKWSYGDKLSDLGLIKYTTLITNSDRQLTEMDQPTKTVNIPIDDKTSKCLNITFHTIEMREK